MKYVFLVFTFFSLTACASTEKKTVLDMKEDRGKTEQKDLGEPDTKGKSSRDTNSDSNPSKACEGNLAEVKAVATSGASGAYQFSITLESPDLGCAQYANWWEVLDENGKLIYRRILGHSHVDEQPFTRSGGPVDIADDKVVIIRAHMNPDGYGWRAMKGSVKDGFVAGELACDFAKDVESQMPLPTGCAF